ncbi:MAG: EamA family transporter [Gomphosphaeria aponina SAG 52.96 = DSM 107014]|uniref:EamA family transporter n=1 Tax=Gomphosphaeria aponina SAG 52.96 = DSM 107014 TaxID=1521640 RepID=A0A941JMY1_9CHRO|nr:EamA family transporter [Gomphosphaeria aponina SAG 52.96 = DSM 107014]
MKPKQWQVGLILGIGVVAISTNPVWVALFSWVWLKEKPPKMMVVGITVALTGAIFIALGDTGGGGENSNPLLGNILALLGSVIVSIYIICGREAQRQGLGIGGYIAIAYTTGALLLLPLPLLFGAGYCCYPQVVYLYIFLMAVFSFVSGSH